jgi:hypothetical protein
MSGKSTYEWWIYFTISLFHSCSREKRYLLERGCTHRRPITDPSPFSTPPFLSSFFVQERKDILYPPSPTLQKWVANRPMSDESISLFLSYILAQERKHTFLREGALIADPSPTHPLLAHHHFSLPFLFKREKISYIHHIGHSRNEWQIDLWTTNTPSRKYIHLLYMDSTLATNDPILRQHIWRQRQLDILFRTGRPIFNIQQDTIHIRSCNNPLFFRDPLSLHYISTSFIQRVERKKQLIN